MGIDNKRYREEVERHRNKAELYLAIILAIVALVAELLIFRLMLRTDEVPARWRPLVWAVLVFFLAAASLWFFVKVTSFPRWLRNQFTRFRLAFLTDWRYTKLARRWAQYVTHGSDPQVWRLRAALANQYAEQERDDLSGDGDLRHRRWKEPDLSRYNPEGRPLIITSFIRYSKMVKALVEAAQKTKGQTILCVTTLSMTLEKWFNFDERMHCKHPEWEDYLSFLRAELRESNNVIFARILLVHEENKSSRLVDLRPESELKRELDSWVWLTRPVTDNPLGIASGSLMPVTLERGRSILEAVKNQFNKDSSNCSVIKKIEDTLAAEKEPYIILPRTEFVGQPNYNQGGYFSRLGNEFIENFHMTMEGGGHHAYYAPVDPNAYLPKYGGNNQPPYPLDLFFVALVESQNPEDLNTPDKLKNSIREPLFCLGAEMPKNDLYMVYLYLLDNYTNSKINFPEIVKYVKGLLGKCQPLG
jgi:hypothetical protein